MARTLSLAVGCLAAASLVACGKSEHATPRPGVGAQGIVNEPVQPDAGNPVVLRNQLDDQKPLYGQPGGAPHSAYSSKADPPAGSGQ